VVSAKDRQGCTLLHLAARHGHECVVRLLLGLGADPRQPNHRGLAPHDLATCPTVRAALEPPRDKASEPSPEVVEPGPAQLPAATLEPPGDEASEPSPKGVEPGSARLPAATLEPPGDKASEPSHTSTLRQTTRITQRHGEPRLVEVEVEGTAGGGG
jgi:ankyrin repeat protein